MATTVNELLEEIKTGLTQKNSSQKDEVRVMQAMLNDTSFVVDVYSNKGKEGTYCPAEDFRDMVGSIVASATKINKDEAKVLANSYEASKNDATTMLNISKEFVNTYIHTGRKLNLGGREDTNFCLIGRDVPEKTKPCPKKVGYDSDGQPIYETPDRPIPAHLGLKAYSSCPKWMR